jgi:hypothetical protein
VQVAGLSRLRFEDVMMTNGVRLAARRCAGKLEQNGRDVTADVVVNPP